MRDWRSAPPLRGELHARDRRDEFARAVARARSAGEILTLMREAAGGIEPHDASQAIASHARHWDEDLLTLVGHSHDSALARNPWIPPRAVFRIADWCVYGLTVTTGFTTGMGNQFRLERWRSLVRAHRLPATGQHGISLYLMAQQRPFVHEQMIPRSRNARKLLAIMPDLPREWRQRLCDLHGPWRF